LRQKIANLKPSDVLTTLKTIGLT